jgi:hypothetical protein
MGLERHGSIQDVLQEDVGKDNGFNPWSVPRAAFSFSSVQAPAGRLNAVQPPLKGLRDEETGVVRRSPSARLPAATIMKTIPSGFWRLDDCR